MICMTCSSSDSSLMKLQTYLDNNTLKQISLVLPDFEIPATQGPVYVCVTCQEQVTTFYRIKRASLDNLYHLNLYEDILKTTSDLQFNDLKIIIDNNKIPAKREQDTEFKLISNSKKFTNDENQFMGKVSNSSSGTKSKNQRASEQKRLKCSDCDKTFTCRSNLETHSRVHTGDKPYKCTMCQKTFTTSSNLNVHKVKHTGKKPHKCDVCPKTFTDKSAVIRHKRIHSDVRPHQCAVCSKTFTQSGNLSAHMRIHTGMKPHVCHICQYKCTLAGNLKEHIRTHTGEKPYTCELCQKSFTQSSSLKDHKRRLHNNKDLN